MIRTQQENEKIKFSTNPDIKLDTKINNNLFENFKKFKQKISIDVKKKIKLHNNPSKNFSTTLSLRNYSFNTNISPVDIHKDPGDSQYKRFSFWNNTINDLNKKEKNNDYITNKKNDGIFLDKIIDNGHILICDTVNSYESKNIIFLSGRQFRYL